MLTKIGRFYYGTNNTDSIIPKLDENNYGVYPWRKISSSDTVYFSSYARSHSLSSLITSIGDTGTYGIALGSGTTPVTDEDYTMESLITSGISASFASQAKAYDAIEGKSYAYVNITVTNTGASDVTISEIGLFITSRCSTTRGDSVSTGAEVTVMVDHTLLNTSVTIPANEAAVIQYRFEIDDTVLPPIE